MTAGEQSVFSTQLQSACEGRTPQGAPALLAGGGLSAEEPSGFRAAAGRLLG